MGSGLRHSQADAGLGTWFGPASMEADEAVAVTHCPRVPEGEGGEAKGQHSGAVGNMDSGLQPAELAALDSSDDDRRRHGVGTPSQRDEALEPGTGAEPDLAGRVLQHGAAAPFEVDESVAVIVVAKLVAVV